MVDNEALLREDAASYALAERNNLRISKSCSAKSERSAAVASSTLFVSADRRAEDNSRKREAALANVPRGGAASGLLPPMRMRWRIVSLVSVAGGTAVGGDLSDVMVG